MAIKTNIVITYFIRTNLYVQNFMVIQKNWSIFTLRQYSLQIGLKTEVMITDHLSPRCREKWFSSLAETNHIIIHGKLTKDTAKVFMSEYNYRFIDI